MSTNGVFPPGVLENSFGKTINPATVPDFSGNDNPALAGSIPLNFVNKYSCTQILQCGHKCLESHIRNELCFTAVCLELIPSRLYCPRGHIIVLHCLTVTLASSHPNDFEQDEYVFRQCSEICGMRLECGHVCKSTCGSCYNGRLHSKCQENCDKVLVCGHLCKEPCSNICPPCQSHCEIRCDHKSCSEKCGKICDACKEECTLKCKHSHCTMKCGESCNRDPCKMPCSKVLPCNHPCIGFCGDPCPKLCRICQKEEVSKIFFGNEDAVTARFVALEDCDHVFEAEGIEKWMKEPGVDIGMKKCPNCFKPIYNTKRFYNYFLNNFQEVQKVKSKFYTVNTSILNQWDSLLQRLTIEWSDKIDNLHIKLGYYSKNQDVSDIEFSVYVFRKEFLKVVTDAKDKLKRNPRFMQPLIGKLNALVQYVLDINGCVSNQIRDEVICEVRRISVSASVSELKTKNQNEYVRQALSRIKSVMSPSNKLNQRSESQVIADLKLAERYVGYLDITNEERVMVARAMGFKVGHWYKCPMGHIYTIGECGRPSQEAICPEAECQARIGGYNHNLMAGNDFSLEMNTAISSAGIF